jgi:hypothetical protein
MRRGSDSDNVQIRINSFDQRQKQRRHTHAIPFSGLQVTADQLIFQIVPHRIIQIVGEWSIIVPNPGFVQKHSRHYELGYIRILSRRHSPYLSFHLLEPIQILANVNRAVELPGDNKRP